LPVSGDEPAIGSFDFCDDEEDAVLEGFLEDLLEPAVFAPALPPLLVGRANAGFRLSQGESPFTRSLGEMVTGMKGAWWWHVPAATRCRVMHSPATTNYGMTERELFGGWDADCRTWVISDILG